MYGTENGARNFRTQSKSTVLGASVLTLHQPFNLVKGVIVDDLHGLFLGVTKTLLSLWFTEKYKSCYFSIARKVIYY